MVTFQPFPGLLHFVCLSQRKVSKILLNSMDNVQSALLNGKKVGQEPAIIKSPEISVYANR